MKFEKIVASAKQCMGKKRDFTIVIKRKEKTQGDVLIGILKNFNEDNNLNYEILPHYRKRLTGLKYYYDFNYRGK